MHIAGEELDRYLDNKDILSFFLPRKQYLTVRVDCVQFNLNHPKIITLFDVYSIKTLQREIMYLLYVANRTEQNILADKMMSYTLAGP